MAAISPLPLPPCSMINAKAEPDISQVQRLVETLLDIVMATEQDLALQARWGALLHRLLRTYRRKLALTVPWRPLFEMLRRQTLEPSQNYEGACLVAVLLDALWRLGGSSSKPVSWWRSVAKPRVPGKGIVSTRPPSCGSTALDAAMRL